MNTYLSQLKKNESLKFKINNNFFYDSTYIDNDKRF